MSHSTSTTLLPLVAMACARLSATVDLPSLGTEEVSVMTRIGLSTLAKRMLASRVLAAFWTTSLSALAFFLGMGYLPPFFFIAGMRPTTGTPSSSSASSALRMRVLSISMSTTMAIARNRPARNATAM